MDIKTINDLLPDEHVLNFYLETPPVVPVWLAGNNLKIILGAGDLDQDPERLNVDFFKEYDVFFCRPLDHDGSLRRNVNALITRYKHQKVICFIDIHDSKQLEVFTTLFTGRFGLIDGYGGHTPHFPLPNIERLLCVGGEAVNVDEQSDTYYSEDDIYRRLSTQEKGGEAFKILTKNNIDFLRGRIRDWFTNNNANNELREFNLRLYRQIEKLLIKNKAISINRELNRELVRNETFNTKETFLNLKSIAGWLLKYDELPPTLRGNITMYKRLWRDVPFVDLVLTKVAAGGRRLRKTRRRKNRRLATLRKT